MNEFLLNVARYIESKDNSLTPVHVITYPDLPNPPPPQNPSDYAQYTGYSTPTPHAPPLEEPLILQQGPSHVTHITNHYHTRQESAFYRHPSPIIICAAPAERQVVHIVREEKRNAFREEKEEKKNANEASPWLGAAVLLGTTVATTVAVSKLALEKREFDDLMEQRKNLKLALMTEEEETFINQFDATFAELRKSRSIITGSALSGGGSLALLGSMLYMGSHSDIASAVALFSGCGAVAGACYAYFFVSDDRNTRCKKLHALAKKIIEKHD